MNETLLQMLDTEKTLALLGKSILLTTSQRSTPSLCCTSETMWLRSLRVIDATWLSPWWNKYANMQCVRCKGRIQRWYSVSERSDTHNGKKHQNKTVAGYLVDDGNGAQPVQKQQQRRVDVMEEVPGLVAL